MTVSAIRPIESQRRETIREDALRFIPDADMGHSGWSIMAVTRLVDYAIDGGQNYKIVNALRTIAHQPTARQVRLVASSVVDAFAARCVTGSESEKADYPKIMALRKLVDETMRAIEDERAVAQITSTDARASVSNLLRLLAMRHPETAEHMTATGALAARIASDMFLAPEVIRDAELSGHLHDVGMLGLDPALVNAKEPSEAEEVALREHIALGERFVRETSDIAHLAPFVRAHHERFDGTGYPDRLAGEGIPIEARIVAVADAAHTMLAEYPKRTGTMPSDAFRELDARAGTEFDPVVVAAASRVVGVRSRRLSA